MVSGQPIESKFWCVSRHLPLRILELAKQPGWTREQGLILFERVQSELDLTLAELRECCRLALPVKNPRARGHAKKTKTDLQLSIGGSLLMSDFLVCYEKLKAEVAVEIASPVLA